VTAYLASARPSASGGTGELVPRIRFYVGVSLLRKALRAWARSPAGSLVEPYVAEAQRAVTDLPGSPRGRR
jgi:hypothetical protein